MLAAKSLGILFLLLAAAPAAAAQAPTAWAGGTVVDEAGRPLAGVRVELLHADNIFLQYDGRGRESRMERLSAGDAESGPRFHAISGADGRIRIADLPADTWFVLRVLQNGFTVLLQRGIASPVAGGQIALGTLRLPRVPTVHGRVVDSRGRPLSGAQVWALSAGDLELRRRLMDSQALGGGEAPVAVTDRNGRFAIPRFEPGILEVCGQGLVPARVTPLAPGPNRIVLSAPPLPRRLSGRVIDGQGLPVAQAKVHLKAHGRDPWLVLAEERLWHPCPQPRRDPAVPLYDKVSLPRGGRRRLRPGGTLRLRAGRAGRRDGGPRRSRRLSPAGEHAGSRPAAFPAGGRAGPGTGSRRLRPRPHRPGAPGLGGGGPDLRRPQRGGRAGADRRGRALPRAGDRARPARRGGPARVRQGGRRSRGRRRGKPPAGPGPRRRQSPRDPRAGHRPGRQGDRGGLPGGHAGAGGPGERR